MNLNNLFEDFYDKVKTESQYTKKLSLDAIELIINGFNYKLELKKYNKVIDNPLELVLQFYKEYNNKYYQIINKGLLKKEINLNSFNNYLDLRNTICNINLTGNDSDVFILVHELAHYIDRKLKPHIILDEHNVLCEVFAYYMEMEFEKRIINNYEELVISRRNNRIYNVVEKMRLVELELYCEMDYLSGSKKFLYNISIEDMELLLKSTNTVNTNLRYSIGYILSNYIQDNNIIVKESLSKYLYDLDVYKIINDFFQSKKSENLIK